MGEITDAVGIQFRLLNTSRGPAVWSPRAQCDKQAYRLKMREVLESQPNLKIKQAEVADLIVEDSSQLSAVSPQPESATTHVGTAAIGCPVEQSSTTTGPRRRVLGIRLRDGRTVGASAVVITTGTFLNGLIHCGEQQYPAGRSGEPNAVLLGEALKKLGLRGCRLKTGTPPRLDGRSIDWSRFPEQPGDVVQLSHQARCASRLAGALLHCLDHGGDASNHPRERPPLAHVQWADPVDRSTILSVD
jgi:tRNA uridine 5-carboxymethylaminomethyl modification enzyme